MTDENTQTGRQDDLEQPGCRLPQADAEYSAEDLEHLSDLEHVRERPSMYIGDTTTRGLAPPGLRSGRQLDRRGDGRLRQRDLA